MFAGMACLAACGCAALDRPGNPNGMAYAGSPGSVYDRAANPPRNNGTATYDPYAALQTPDVTPTPAGTSLPGMNRPPR